MQRRGVDEEFFPEAFRYEEASDTYSCPAGKTLRWPPLAANKRPSRTGKSARRWFKRNSRDCSGGSMITNDQELTLTLQRIASFQEQVAHLRKVETNPANYHAAVSGFLAEVDRMQLEVRGYLSLHPTECLVGDQGRGQ